MKPESGETNADILRAIREKVDIETIGSQVFSITETRSGEILIRLSKEDTKREELVEALKTNLESRATIRGFVKYDDIEIQDLDGITTDTEVASRIRHSLGLAQDDSTVTIKSIRQTHAGTQRTTVRLKSIDTLKMANTGRIKIGWIYARVRMKVTAIRCFRCLGYGHIRHNCKGPDRTGACSTCNSKLHKASDCSSPPNCVACADVDSPSDHYPGSGKCTEYRNALARIKTPPSKELRETANEAEAQNIISNV